MTEALAGNPWRGLWRQGVGIALPMDAVKTLQHEPVGSASASQGLPSALLDDFRGADYPAHGDCLLIKVPGLPVPKTSLTDKNKGMTWENHAFLAGANHLLYGIELGRDCWIYIDPQKKPWLAKVRPSSTADCAEFVFRNLRDKNGQKYTYPLNWIVWNRGVAGRRAYLDDADETGSQVTIGDFSWGVGQWPPSISGRAPVMITGTPGVDLQLAAHPAYLEFSAVQHSDSRIFDFDYRCYSAGVEAGNYSLTLIFGLGGVAVPYLIRMTRQWTAQPRWADGGTYSCVGEFTLVHPLGELSMNYSAQFSIAPYGVKPNDTQVSIDGYRSYQFGESNPSGFDVPQLLLVRRTSKVYELVIVEYSGGIALGQMGQLKSLALCMPDRVVSTGYMVSARDAGRYFSYNPVTLELRQSETPICFC